MHAVSLFLDAGVLHPVIGAHVRPAEGAAWEDLLGNIA